MIYLDVTLDNRAYLASCLRHFAQNCLRQLLLSARRYPKFGTVETNIKDGTNKTKQNVSETDNPMFGL